MDRDGTLIKAYPGRPAQLPNEVELLPTVCAGMPMLKELGYLLIVVTNQGGVGQGYQTLEGLHLVNDRMQDLLWQHCGTPADAIYFCPHKLDAGCICRKPKPGMILRACAEWNIDPSLSFMVGDDVRDMQAGVAAKLRKNFMIISDRYQENKVADLVFSSFLEAVDAIKVLGVQG